MLYEVLALPFSDALEKLSACHTAKRKCMRRYCGQLGLEHHLPFDLQDASNVGKCFFMLFNQPDGEINLMNQIFTQISVIGFQEECD